MGIKTPPKRQRPFLERLDLFGKSVQFTLDGQEQVKTAPGGVLSICFMAIFLCLAVAELVKVGSESTGLHSVDKPLEPEFKANLGDDGFEIALIFEAEEPSVESRLGKALKNGYSPSISTDEAYNQLGKLITVTSSSDHSPVATTDHDQKRVLHLQDYELTAGGQQPSFEVRLNEEEVVQRVLDNCKQDKFGLEAGLCSQILVKSTASIRSELTNWDTARISSGTLDDVEQSATQADLKWYGEASDNELLLWYYGTKLNEIYEAQRQKYEDGLPQFLQEVEAALKEDDSTSDDGTDGEGGTEESSENGEGSSQDSTSEEGAADETESPDSTETGGDSSSSETTSEENSATEESNSASTDSSSETETSSSSGSDGTAAEEATEGVTDAATAEDSTTADASAETVTSEEAATKDSTSQAATEDAAETSTTEEASVQSSSPTASTDITTDPEPATSTETASTDTSSTDTASADTPSTDTTSTSFTDTSSTIATATDTPSSPESTSTSTYSSTPDSSAPSSGARRRRLSSSPSYSFNQYQSLLLTSADQTIMTSFLAEYASLIDSSSEFVENVNELAAAQTQIQVYTELELKTLQELDRTILKRFSASVRTTEATQVSTAAFEDREQIIATFSLSPWAATASSLASRLVGDGQYLKTEVILRSKEHCSKADSVASAVDFISPALSVLNSDKECSVATTKLGFSRSSERLMKGNRAILAEFSLSLDGFKTQITNQSSIHDLWTALAFIAGLYLALYYLFGVCGKSVSSVYYRARLSQSMFLLKSKEVEQTPFFDEKQIDLFNSSQARSEEEAECEHEGGDFLNSSIADKVQTYLQPIKYSTCSLLGQALLPSCCQKQSKIEGLVSSKTEELLDISQVVKKLSKAYHTMSYFNTRDSTDLMAVNQDLVLAEGEEEDEDTLERKQALEVYIESQFLGNQFETFSKKMKRAVKTSLLHSSVLSYAQKKAFLMAPPTSYEHSLREATPQIDIEASTQNEYSHRAVGDPQYTSASVNQQQSTAAIVTLPTPVNQPRKKSVFNIQHQQQTADKPDDIEDLILEIESSIENTGGEKRQSPIRQPTLERDAQMYRGPTSDPYSTRNEGFDQPQILQRPVVRKSNVEKDYPTMSPRDEGNLQMDTWRADQRKSVEPSLESELEMKRVGANLTEESGGDNSQSPHFRQFKSKTLAAQLQKGLSQIPEVKYKQQWGQDSSSDSVGGSLANDESKAQLRRAYLNKSSKRSSRQKSARLPQYKQLGIYI